MLVSYVYRDENKCAWAKKIHITGFIKDKEYELVKGKKGKIDKLWVEDAKDLVHVQYVPMKRQRRKEDWYDLSEIDFCGLAARGTRLTTRPVASVKTQKNTK